MSVSEKGDEAITSSDGDVILVLKCILSENHTAEIWNVYTSFRGR